MKAGQQLRKFLAGGIVLLSVALVVMIMLRYQKVENPPVTAETPKADLSLAKIEYTETKDGQPSWNLQADSAAHELADGVTQIENVRLVFFGEKDLENLVLTARNGEWRSENGQLKVLGDVVISSPRGYTCYTDWLNYSERTRRLTTDAKVRLVSANLEMTGRGMEMDVPSQTLQLLAEVWTRWTGPLVPERRG